MISFTPRWKTEIKLSSYYLLIGWDTVSFLTPSPSSRLVGRKAGWLVGWLAGYAVTQSEGRGFDFRWDPWLNPFRRIMVLGSTHPLTVLIEDIPLLKYRQTLHFSGDKYGRPVSVPNGPSSDPYNNSVFRIILIGYALLNCYKGLKMVR